MLKTTAIGFLLVGIHLLVAQFLTGYITKKNLTHCCLMFATGQTKIILYVGLTKTLTGLSIISPVPPKYLTATLTIQLAVLVVKSNIKIMAKRNTTAQPEPENKNTDVIILSENVELLPELQTVIESSKLAISKAQKHALALSPFMQVLNDLTKPLADMDKENPTPEMAETARTTRLKMVKNRTASAEVKDALKSDLLIEGKLIDSLYGVIKNASELTESEYSNIEKFEINRQINTQNGTTKPKSLSTIKKPLRSKNNKNLKPKT